MKANASIDECLRGIVIQLKRLRRPAAQLLEPGLSRAQIASVEARLPFKLPRELVALYRASNGTRARSGTSLDTLQLFPGFYLLSLEDAASEYRRMRRAPQWQKGWFPFFANGAGDYYLVSCAPAAPGVIGFLRGEPEQPVEYASVSAMFRTLAESFAQKAFFVKRGAFTIDDEKHGQIALKLNPRVAFWREEAAEAAEAARNAEAQKMTLKASQLVMKKPKKPFEALALFEKVLEVQGHPQWVYVNALYAVILCFETRPLAPVRIRRMLELCLAQKTLHGDGHLNAAFCWIALGKKDEAIASLQTAKRKGVDLKRHLVEPLFLPLATDKRFIALKRSSERSRDAGSAAPRSPPAKAGKPRSK